MRRCKYILILALIYLTTLFVFTLSMYTLQGFLEKKDKTSYPEIHVTKIGANTGIMSSIDLFSDQPQYSLYVVIEGKKVFSVNESDELSIKDKVVLKHSGLFNFFNSIGKNYGNKNN